METDVEKYSYDSMLDEKEVARLLSNSPRTLQAWRQRGVGPPYHKLEYGIRYKFGYLVRWCEERRVDPGSNSYCPVGAKVRTFD